MTITPDNVKHETLSLAVIVLHRALGTRTAELMRIAKLLNTDVNIDDICERITELLVEARG